MNMNEKIGRTFWDFCTENKFLLIILFLLFLGVAAFGIYSNYQIKYGDLQVSNRNSVIIQESPDPIGIVGNWKYTVTPLEGEKLLGVDPVRDTLMEMYDKYEGTFKIDPISKGSSSYSMPPGKRACAFIGNNPILNTEKDLYFSQIYYSKNPNTNAYYFKFDVSIIPLPNTNTNQGFVEVPILVKDINDRINSMTGKIYYLYQKRGNNKNKLNTQIWQLVKIEFTRNN